MVHPQLPWLAATPDYFIKAKSNANGATNHLLEIKTTSRNIPEVCPKHVQQQVVTQLFVIKSAMPDFFNGDTWAAVVFKSTTDKKAPPSTFIIKLDSIAYEMLDMMIAKAWGAYVGSNQSVLDRFVEENPHLVKQGEMLVKQVASDENIAGPTKTANTVANDVEDDHMATLKGHVYLPSTKQVEAVLDTTPGKSRILTLSEGGKTVRKRSLLAAIPIYGIPQRIVNPTSIHVNREVLILKGTYANQDAKLFKYNATKSTVLLTSTDKKVHILNQHLCLKAPDDNDEGITVVHEDPHYYEVPRKKAKMFLEGYQMGMNVDVVLTWPESNAFVEDFFFGKGQLEGEINVVKAVEDELIHVSSSDEEEECLIQSSDHGGVGADNGGDGSTDGVEMEEVPSPDQNGSTVFTKIMSWLNWK